MDEIKCKEQICLKVLNLNSVGYFITNNLIQKYKDFNLWFELLDESQNETAKRDAVSAATPATALMAPSQ